MRFSPVILGHQQSTSNMTLVQSSKLKKGDKVIVPALSWSTTVSFSSIWSNSYFLRL